MGQSDGVGRPRAGLAGDVRPAALPAARQGRPAGRGLTPAGYAFQDTVDAAARLALLHTLFEPASRGFLDDHAIPQAGLAYDLGCGPGFTTRLLRDAAAP